MPSALADPEQVPDLSGYAVANVTEYATYYNYPTTNGVQFVAPGGYRCRVTYITDKSQIYPSVARPRAAR